MTITCNTPITFTTLIASTTPDTSTTAVTYLLCVLHYLSRINTDPASTPATQQLLYILELSVLTSLSLIGWCPLQATVDRSGHSVAGAVQTVIQATHQDSLQRLVLPSFEASTRHMFQQMNGAFTDGLNECEF